MSRPLIYRVTPHHIIQLQEKKGSILRTMERSTRRAVHRSIACGVLGAYAIYLPSAAMIVIFF